LVAKEASREVIEVFNTLVNLKKVHLILFKHLTKEQDDDEEKLMSMSGDGKLAPQKRRFRESAHPSLEQVREIIRKKKDGETLETFFNVRGKDSALMKNRTVKAFEGKASESKRHDGNDARRSCATSFIGRHSVSHSQKVATRCFKVIERCGVHGRIG